MFDKDKQTPVIESLLGPGKLHSVSGMRCAVSWSGGKDSCLAMYRAVQSGAHVETIINMKVEGGERSRSHGIRSGVVEAQARALGVRLESAETSWGDYEEKFTNILGSLASDGVEAVIFGDIDLQDHLDWETMVCARAGLTPVLPIWLGGRMDLVREFLDAGFETRVIALKNDLLSPHYLGRILSLDLAAEFERQGIDACGENGEFHTVVTDGPLFHQSIDLVPGEHVLRDGHWFLDYELKPAPVSRKHNIVPD